MKKVVAIVGRPNVGKSTLFNRLVGGRRAITDPTPGVTRDRIYGEVDWLNRSFVAIDTGGWEDLSDPQASGSLVEEIRRQVRVALGSADAVIMMVDGRDGLTGMDEQIAEMLRPFGLPVVLAVNKVDAFTKWPDLHDFYSLGLGEPIPISAEHGRNTGDLLDAVVATLPEEDETPEDEEDAPIRVAIVGRPNVGKSSITNSLLGDQRVMVHTDPGTTRDAVEVEWTWEDHRFIFVDTAGIRRRARIDDRVEKYSVSSALRAVRDSDVVVLVLDAEEMVTEQDQRVASYTREQGRAAIVVVNKWDTVPRETGVWEAYQAILRDRLYFIDYALSLSTSATEGRRIMNIPPLVLEAYENYRRRFRTSDLNRAVREVVERHRPPGRRGRNLKIYYATQVADGPPTFLLFCNEPDLVTEGYRRYLDRSLRSILGLRGTPIRLLFRLSE
ncbi:MAG: ribosome biogenesis GTPase Der [Bacillota bacterium]